ncbi:DUF637 domain-containing protein [Pseudomonas beijingensis]|nr:DUF637 domain-containing protein [Pseudomonas sp. FP2262]WLH47084.1 DUF637 domain-containing protein [Pseudomonas sp. FP2262]
MVASKIAAGNEAYLVAGKQLSLLAEQNRDYSLYDMKKKGSWGSKAARRDEVTQLTHIGSEISTGGDLMLVSGGDQTYQVAKLQSGNDLIIDSGGRITFEGVKDFHDESHTKSKSDLAWYKMKGEGRTDETLRQSALVAQGKLVIKAVDGLRIDVKQVDQQSVSQTIDAMVKAEPDLAWMKEAQARGDIDWRQVKEIHDSFKYENSGLGAGAKIAIAILMSFIMGPAGFGLSGTNLAVATSLSTTAVTSTIENKGNLGRALKETVSADSLKSAAIAGFTAYAFEYADKEWFTSADSASTTTQGVEPSAGSAGSASSASNSSKDIFRWSNATDTAIRTTGRAVISSSISTAIGGGSFGSNFNAALLGEAGNVAMATGFNWVGDTIKFPDGGPQKIVAHAIMGGLLAELTGSDFKTGAVAAGLNEALIPGMAKVADGNEQLQLMLSQLTGLLAAAAVDGDLNTGSKIAEKATTFNYLFHAELVEREQKLNTCASPADCQSVRDYYNNLDTARNKEFGRYCQQSPASCAQVTRQLADEIPANEKLLHDGRSSGFSRSATLWEITRSNVRAINTGIVETTRPENGNGAALLAELASEGLNPDRDLFASTAGGKGGTTGVKVGVVGDGPKGGDNPVLGLPRVGSAKNFQMVSMGLMILSIIMLEMLLSSKYQLKVLAAW